jgi:hypothetical protein
MKSFTNEFAQALSVLEGSWQFDCTCLVEVEVAELKGNYFNLIVAI